MSFELPLPFLRPIGPLALDESISEIMSNPDASWSTERDGRLDHEPRISFDAGKLRSGLEVVATQLGKKLDEDNPLLNTQLLGGSRLAAVIPHVVRPSPALTIRRFTSRHYTVDDLIARGTLTCPLADCLAEPIRRGKTLLISGKTAIGEAILLRILARFIPEDHIVVTEDGAELHVQKPNILAVECETDSFKANIFFDDLLKSVLRWRPDRIVVGEVRGIEARALLDSFNTVHAGSLATIHANSAEKALRRFVNLVMRKHAQTTFSDTEAGVGEAIDLVVRVERQPGRPILHWVLALRRYYRAAKRFLFEPVFEIQRGNPASFHTEGLLNFPIYIGETNMPLLEISKSAASVLLFGWMRSQQHRSITTPLSFMYPPTMSSTRR
jgi:pilus assembly protein CpaF